MKRGVQLTHPVDSASEADAFDVGSVIEGECPRPQASAGQKVM